MDLDLVSRRLAELALNADGILRADPFTPLSITEPHFYVGEYTVEYDQTYGGLMDVLLTCRLMVSRSDDEAGQALLKSFVKRSGPSSIKAALEAGRGAPGEAALGGACDDIQVTGVRANRLYTVGTGTYVGAEWTIRVIGTDSEEETP